MAVLRSVVQRMAAIVRAFGVSYVVVQVAIWHVYYAAHPWLLAGPLAAVAWGAAAAAYLLRRRPAWPLIVLDTSFYAALAIVAGTCVPPDMRGVAGNWLYVATTSQVIVTVWFAPRVLVVLLGVAPEVAYLASVAVTPPGRVQGNTPVVSGALLLVVLAVHWTARGMLDRRAARADLGFAAADQEAHDQYVILSRTIERREHERLLHDTMLNTLTAIGRGSSGPAAVARCSQDIALLEHALAAPGDPAGPPSPGGDSLVADVQAVAGEMRARGMTVHVAVSGGEPGPGDQGPGDQGPGGPGPGVPGLPVPVASALVHATREALANVAAHAGTREAWVTITRGAGSQECGPAESAPADSGPGEGNPGEGNTVRVTVRDAGTGFDPAQVDPGRLGLRRSITERVADWGGRVSVRSAPGQGTVVSMNWPGAVPAAEADLVGVDSSW
jgi:signal transduction histidine kinase